MPPHEKKEKREKEQTHSIAPLLNLQEKGGKKKDVCTKKNKSHSHKE